MPGHTHPAVEHGHGCADLWATPTPGQGQTPSDLLLVHSAPGTHPLIMRACYALLLEPGPCGGWSSQELWL